MAKVHGESKLTFLESTSIIIGHGVGSGILSVPFLASRNNWHDIIWIAVVAYCMNLLLHFMIAELSLNNNGAQFIKCFENELFVGKLKMACTWLAFGLLGFSVVVNVSGFITGAAAVFSAWFHLPSVAGMLIFYVLAASVVYIGMKLVGICEKIAVISMFGVIGILFVATMLSETTELSTKFYSNNNVLALYSMIAFSLSAVMSVPQVVKGLEGDEKGIRKAIAAGTGLNMGLILLIGPTMQIFKMEVNSIGLYASDFIKMSTYTDPFGEGKFSSEWTVFYWGWWIAFMPMMGMFVGKISRGRTIKNVMWGQLLWGTLGCCCSFMIFGGYSLYLQQSGKVDLATILAEEGNSGAIIAILQTLPMSKIMMLFLCIVCFVYLATTIDSCAYVLAGTTTKRLSYKEDPARWNRILWAVLFCVLSIGLMIIGGLEAVKTISVLTGLPLIAVLIVLMVSVKRMLKEDEEKEEKRK